MHCPELNRRRNLSIKQFKALTDLKENKSIMIKKADKGSNVVIQNVDDYIKEGLRQLGDEKFYKMIDYHPTEEFRKKIYEELECMLADKELLEKTFLFLIKGDKRRSIFCMLPKIHKNKFPSPGQPIVSSVNSHTEKISMLLDIILQPFGLKIRSYIKDTGDILSKTQGLELASNEWMFSMDVTSLYTNIPHDDGIGCIKNILSQHVNSTPRNSSLITLLEFVLKSNNFMFNQDNYLQINGTAMGTRVLPTYVNLFMDSLEQQYIYPHTNCPRIWFRFIDDI